MKKITFTLALMVSFVCCIVAQPGAIDHATHNTNHHRHEKNGDSTLGPSFDTTVCGLNYIHAISMITTRYNPYTTTNTVGYGFPDTLSLSGLPSTNGCGVSIIKAYLYWTECYRVGTSDTQSVIITDPQSNTSTLNGTLIGSGANICWGEIGTHTFRVDMTNYINGNGNYILDSITGVVTPNWEVEGALLLVIYKDNNANYEGTIVLNDGDFGSSGIGSAIDTISGFNVCQIPLLSKGFIFSCDHQDNVSLNHISRINNIDYTFPNLFVNFDDTVTSYSNGQSSAVFRQDIAGDCFLMSIAGVYYRTTCISCSASGLVGSIASSSVTCQGTAVETVSGGNPPYAYIWSNGDTTSTINFVFSGTYYVTVTDSLGCSFVDSTHCNVPGLVGNISNTTVPCLVTSTVTVSGGHLPYSYIWSNGATTNVINVLVSGTYHVTVTDSLGCTYIGSTICNVPGLTGSVSGSYNPCQGVATVTVSGGILPYNYIWSNGGTTSSINIITSGIYHVTVTDSTGCLYIGSINILDTLPNLNPQSYCIVTVDTTTNKNMLIWDKTNNVGTASYNIYKETTFAGVYALLANQLFGTFSTFIDTTSQPIVVAARYKITTVDSCGVESDTTPHHKTIHLTVNQGTGNSWNLIWDAYEGITFPTYYIMRGTTPHNLVVIDSVQSTLYSYTDLNPPNGMVYYAIEMVGFTLCTPSAPPHGKHITNLNTVSLSNIENQIGNGIGDISYSGNTVVVYPNPSSHSFNIDYHLSSANSLFKIYDVTGRCVYLDNLTGFKGTKYCAPTLNYGVYFYQIMNDKGTMEGKIVIER